MPGRKNVPKGINPGVNDFAKYFGRLTRAGQEKLAELVNDPDLLDINRAVALMMYFSKQLVEDPDEEMILRIVNSRVAAGIPATADEVRRDLAEASALQVQRLGKLQALAQRSQRLDEMLLQVVLPVLKEVGEALRMLASRHIEDPTAREAFEQELDAVLLAAIGKVDQEGNR